MKLIPTVDLDNAPLDPTTPSKARKLIKYGKAKPFKRLGLFCIKLTYKASRNINPVTLGIDPGSKKEAYTLANSNGTILNIQCDAIDWVKDSIEQRANARRARRFRKTPCRQPRWANRASSKRENRVPPSTKARWDLKIRIIRKLCSIFPISKVVFEDIKAVSKKGKKRWNVSFSPLEVGKKYFSNKISEMGLELELVDGFQTHEIRHELSLKKIKDKLSDSFDAHCVDSWVLANKGFGRKEVDNKEIHYLKPYKFNRRSLHSFQPGKKPNPTMYRPKSGGTRLAGGFKRGSIVKLNLDNYPKIKVKVSSPYFLVTGQRENKNSSRLTICPLYDKDSSGKKDLRISRNIKPEDLSFVAYNSFYYRTNHV